MRDGKTNLYPFMIASYTEDEIFKMKMFKEPFEGEGENEYSYLDGEAREIREKATLACLTTIYELLRADPVRVHG